MRDGGYAASRGRRGRPSLGYALLPHEPRWAVASQPIVYGHTGVIVAVFAREGIVFKRAWTT